MQSAQASKQTMLDVVASVGSFAALFISKAKDPESHAVTLRCSAYRSSESKPFVSSTESVPVVGSPDRWFVVALQIPEDATEAMLTVWSSPLDSTNKLVQLALSKLDLKALKTTGRIRLLIDSACPEIKLVIVPRDSRSPLEEQMLMNMIYGSYAFPSRNTILREICGEVKFGYIPPQQFLNLRIKRLESMIRRCDDLRIKSRRAQGLFSDDEEAKKHGYFVGTLRIVGVRNLLQNQRVPGSKSLSSPFVSVSIQDPSSSSLSRRVGRTNTEYQTADPVFGTNANVSLAEHSKPVIDYEPGRFGRIGSDGQSMEFYIKENESIVLTVVHERHSVYQGLTHHPMCMTLLSFDTLVNSTNVVQEFDLKSMTDGKSGGSHGKIFLVTSLKNKPSNNPFDMVDVQLSLETEKNRENLSNIPTYWLSQFLAKLKSNLQILKVMSFEIEQRRASEATRCFKPSTDKKKLPCGASTTNLHQCEFEICSTQAPFETRSRQAYTTCGVPSALALGVKELSSSLFELNRKLAANVPIEFTGDPSKFNFVDVAENSNLFVVQPGVELPVVKCTEDPPCSNPILNVDDQCGSSFHRQDGRPRVGSGVASAAASSKNTFRTAAASFASRFTTPAPPSNVGGGGDHMSVSQQKLPTLASWQISTETCGEIFLRETVAVSQALAPTASAFASEALLAVQRGDKDAKEWGDQMSKAGFLVGWESLVSTHGPEMVMLADVISVVEYLNKKCRIVVETASTQISIGVDIRLQQSDGESDAIEIVVGLPQDHFTRLFPDIVAQQDKKESSSLMMRVEIQLFVVLFSQGVNETQSISNYLNKEWASRQAEINRKSIGHLMKYALLFNKTVPLPVLRLNAIIENQREDEKEVDVLLMADDAVRALKGARQIMCKSGKDRTAMAVTLEQSRIGASVLQTGDARDMANLMREFGVRIYVAEKNVGSKLYSFNIIQRMALPKDYRPPPSVIQDIATSYAKKDS